MVKVKRTRKILLARANESLKLLPSFFREFVLTKVPPIWFSDVICDVMKIKLKKMIEIL